MESLNIYFLTSNVIPIGTYFRSHNLAIALTKLGQKVTVFSVDSSITRPKEEIRDSVLYKLIPYNRLNSLKRCLIDYGSCDVVHLFQPFLSPALAWQWILPKQAKTLFYDWDDLWIGGLLTEKFLESPLSMWRYLTIGQIEKNFPRKADHVTTISHFLANLAFQRKAKKVTVIYNPIAPSPSFNKHLAREKLGLRKDGLYVGFMGQSYGLLDWCFRALKENLHLDSRLRFALCGRHSKTLTGLDDEVLQRIDYLGFLPSSSSTREFAAALDVGLLPLSDTTFHHSRFPIKFSEYLAAGIPVFCSEVGECATISKDLPFVFKAGKTCEEFVKSFSQLVTLMQNDSLPKVDQEKVRQIFSWERVGQKLLESYYQELANKPAYPNKIGLLLNNA